MYNLFVSGRDEDWADEPWLVDIDRCVRVNEYTNDELAKRFGALDATAERELKRLPCVFAYESPCRKTPKFGVITGITKRQGQVRIEYEIKRVDPFLSVEDLSLLAFELDISSWEMNRTHWAVKAVDLAKELEVRGINLPAWARDSTKVVDITTHKFDVALSFSGEFRDVVEQIASELKTSIGIDSCFYDNHYIAQLARLELDTLLQDIYRNRSKLIVVFLGGDYQRRDWCGIEFRVIKEIIMERDHKKQDLKKIMFIKMDDEPVDGIFRTDGYIDGRRYRPGEIARFIRERIELLV